MAKHNKFLTLAAAGAATVSATDVAAESGFDGIYAGIGLGMLNGTGGDDYNYALESNGANIFAGYNVVTGTGLMYGGEFGGWATDHTSSSDYGVGSLLSAKLRLGRVFDDTLVYASAGYWKGEYTWDSEEEAEGFLYGVGFEQNLSDTMFVGLDYTVNAADADQYKLENGNIGTMSLRGGFRF
jgi:hypothetical protein